MRGIPILLALAAFATPASADVVVLRGGGRIRGTVVAETPSQVTIDVGPGEVSVARVRISAIQRGATALEEFRRRAEAIAPGDLDAWLALAQWAQDADLGTQAREAFEQVARLDPNNETAQAALGNVLQNGRWMSKEDAYRSRGYVKFEGQWLSPEEHRARLEERRVDLERARIEAEARTAEAEAKAREAESEARAREAEAEAATTDDWWIGQGGIVASSGRSHRRGKRESTQSPGGEPREAEPCRATECPDRTARRRQPQVPSAGHRAGAIKEATHAPGPAERRGSTQGHNP